MSKFHNLLSNATLREDKNLVQTYSKDFQWSKLKVQFHKNIEIICTFSNLMDGQF